MACHPARARELLCQGKSAVFRRFPFTVIIKNRDGGEVQSVELKVDPDRRQNHGSCTGGRGAPKQQGGGLGRGGQLLGPDYSGCPVFTAAASPGPQ